MDSTNFFEDWSGLIRVLVIGTLAYAGLVISLRVSGKRTLSKMNAFDLVVTVALGSTLATVILSKDVALAEGIVAFVLLISLQFVVTWLSVRSQKVGELVKSSPTLLFYDGAFLHENMKRTRVVEQEVLAAVRQQGIASMDDVGAVILETDGSMAVVERSKSGMSALASVKGMDRR